MLLQADAAFVPLPDKSIHCVMTSPPYWGLRKYMGEQGRGEFPHLGLEKTPEEYIKRIVKIFEEVKRVLRDDGVVWLNMGDCYAGSWGNYGSRQGGQREVNVEKFHRHGAPNGDYRPPTSQVSIQQGNIMLMPHRIAIALQDDGWIVRNDLIWYKRNPMPESVAGWRFENGRLRQGSWRHTRAHEYIFQLVKKMNYYCNREAVKEISITNDPRRPYTSKGAWEIDGRPERQRHGGELRDNNVDGRNPRSVLDVPTAPYKGAHYATFPPNLIAPLIRTSCPRRCCPECGTAWAPVVEREKHSTRDVESQRQQSVNASGRTDGKTSGPSGMLDITSVINYRPTCSHNHNPIPGIILDPFIGSGTTGAVARELQRRWIGLDISMEYLDQQAKIRALSWTPSKALDGLPLFQTKENDQ